MKSDKTKNTNPIQIFVEGKSDYQLIYQIVKYWFNYPLFLKTELRMTEGWTKIVSSTAKGISWRQFMRNNSDNGGVNLIIFDADNDIEQRREEILKWKKEHDLDFELFLFPNNQSPGAVEDLLMQCINPHNQPIIDCWKSYVACLKTKKIEGRSRPLTIPARKSEVYCYLETLVGTTKKEKDLIKDENRNFLNPDHWDMDCAAIQPLKNFLKPYFE